MFKKFLFKAQELASEDMLEKDIPYEKGPKE